VKDTILPELEKLEAKAQERTLIPDGIPLVDLADAVVRGKIKLSPQQMRLLIELLPYHLPKLSAVAVGHFTEQDFAARLDRAIRRSAAGAPLKLIEAQAVEVDEIR
jgi:hypothetical protein